MRRCSSSGPRSGGCTGPADAASGTGAEVAVAWLAWGSALILRRPIRLPVRYDAWLYGHAAVFVAFWLGRAATGTLPW